MKYLRKIITLLEVILGELQKLKFRLFFKLLYKGINECKDNDKKIIVSLTSYGRRVEKVVKYAIMSLMCQEYKPDLIILWLDNKNWNSRNIPSSLLRLQKLGLSIFFYDDIKSYKKFIPSLEKYPNDLIITCDDDLIYKPDYVKGLIEAYYNNPHELNVYRAHTITTNIKGDIASYNNWSRAEKGDKGFNFFPTSGGGCIINSELLHVDVLSRDIFLKLAPNADDVWLYFMSILNGTAIHVCKSKNMYYEIDALYQFLHKGSNLKFNNVGMSQNDIQIQAVISYYKIKCPSL